jgi:hypothetical protein
MATDLPELSLWFELQSARLTPQTLNLRVLLKSADSAIATLPESIQMQVAGEIILQVAQILSLRAEVLIEDWENSYRDPVVDQGFFSDLVRQTMAVDLSDLIEPVPLGKRRLKPDFKVEFSIAAPVDKSAVLAMVEQMATSSKASSELPQSDEQEKQKVLEVTHAEDVLAWADAITQWMQQRRNDEAVSLLGLQQALGMPLVDVWLGLLLGEQQQYVWEQREDFYSDARELCLRHRYS